MSTSVAKFAPTAVVIAAVGYCCWPYLDDPGQRPRMDEPRKLPEVSAAVLNPVIEPMSDRDPFGLTGDPELFKVIEGTKNKKGASTVAQSDNKTATQQVESVDVAATPATTVPEVDPEEARRVAERELQSALGGLSLNATFVRGERRVAIINNETFVEGDNLDRVNSTIHAIVISKVYPHKVVLQRKGSEVELSYRNFTTTAASSSRTVSTSQPTSTDSARNSYGASSGTSQRPKTQERGTSRPGGNSRNRPGLPRSAVTQR